MGSLLPLSRPQSGRSGGEKAGKQAAWQRGWVQHHEAADSAQEPQAERDLPACGPRGGHPPGGCACDRLGWARPARRPLAVLPGGWCGPEAPWAFFSRPGLTRFSGSLLLLLWRL